MAEKRKNKKVDYIVNKAKKCETLQEFLDEVKYSIGRVYFLGEVQTPYGILYDLRCYDIDYEIFDVEINVQNRHVDIILDRDIHLYIKF